MPDSDLIHELTQLKASALRSDALLSAARGLATLPVAPDQPSMALIPLADAVQAQQEAIERIQSILERILE